jgi:hypothetical protein
VIQNHTPGVNRGGETQGRESSSQPSPTLEDHRLCYGGPLTYCYGGPLP